MSNRSVRFGAIVGIGTLALVGTSCSSDSNAVGPTTVDVAIKEWKFEPTRTSAPAGKVTFTATNNGKEVHELVLFQTDLAPGDLPTDEDGAVDERGEGLTPVDEVEDVKPGKTKSFTVNLKPGKYVMACNVVEDGEVHYEHKMYRAFTVS